MKLRATFYPHGCLFNIVCLGNSMEEIFNKFEKKYKAKNKAKYLPAFTMVCTTNLYSTSIKLK